MKVLSLWLFLAGAAWAQVKIEKTKPKPRDDRPPRALEPLIYESEDEALENAKKRNQPVIVAVAMTVEGDIPVLFSNAVVARASRASVALASTDYYPDNEFFKSRRIVKEQIPCFLLLDPYGNVLDTRPPNTDPNVLLAAARNVMTLMRSIEKEIPNIVAKAEALKDEKALLDLVRPILSKHYRGYAGLERLHELVTQTGKARLSDPAGLEAAAKDYAHTPIEALALVAIAKAEDKKGNRDTAKTTLKKVMDELPWPENAEAHAQAKAILDEFRKEEIKRRLEEREKRKKEQP
jgi:hypothetical protein